MKLMKLEIVVSKFEQDEHVPILTFDELPKMVFRLNGDDSFLLCNVIFSVIVWGFKY